MSSDMQHVPRRVLMTADAVGGVWTYSLELARAFSARGIQTAIATMGAPPNAAQRSEAARIADLEIFAGPFRLEWMEDPWTDVLAAGDWLLDLEARLDPDIVHLNGYAHAALDWRAPTLVAAHSCVLSWWRAVKREPPPPEWEHYRQVVQRGLAAAKMIVAPTRAMLLTLAENYDAPLDTARVIPNGRQAALFPPGQKSGFLLAAGRLWDEGKNMAALERVAPRLAWPLYLAGETARPAGRSLGQLSPEELAGWLSRAAIYVMPARYEPFGLSVLEAALAGCALVLGDIPSLRENWTGAAVFVPPDDDAAIERALTRLIERPQEQAALQARARLRALPFTPERMAEGYLAAYGALQAGARKTLCA